jgi:hypothetical protein
VPRLHRHSIRIGFLRKVENARIIIKLRNFWHEEATRIHGCRRKSCGFLFPGERRYINALCRAWIQRHSNV